MGFPPSMKLTETSVLRSSAPAAGLAQGTEGNFYDRPPAARRIKAPSFESRLAGAYAPALWSASALAYQIGSHLRQSLIRSKPSLSFRELTS
jgi:hypothetical protein